MSKIHKNEEVRLRIFIHGNSGTPSNFKNIAEREDILLTIAGHGGSKAPAKCDLINLGRLLGEEISGLTVSDIPYQIIAHSLGCNVTVHAIKHLLDTGKSLPEKLTFIAGPLLTKVEQLGELFSSEHSGSIFTQLNPLRKSLERAIILNNLKNDSVNQFIEGFKITDPNFRVRFIDSVSKGEFLNELEIIKEQTIPTYFLLGSKDPFINKENLFEQASQVENINFFLLEGLAHYPHLENPSLLKKTLLALEQEPFHHYKLEVNGKLMEQGN